MAAVTSTASNPYATMVGNMHLAGQLAGTHRAQLGRLPWSSPVAPDLGRVSVVYRKHQLEKPSCRPFRLRRARGIRLLLYSSSSMPNVLGGCVSLLARWTHLVKRSGSRRTTTAKMLRATQYEAAISYLTLRRASCALNQSTTSDSWISSRKWCNGCSRPHPV